MDCLVSTRRTNKYVDQRIRLALTLFAVITYALPAFAQEERVHIKNVSPIKTGDAIVIELALSPQNIESIFFNRKSMNTFTYKGKTMLVLPIPGRESAGLRKLEITTTNKEKITENITVNSRSSQVIILPVPKAMNVTPQKLVENLGTQKVSIATNLNRGSNAILVSKPFGLPLADNRSVSSPYGEIRKTGNESIRHIGVDFGGKTGSIVYAINDGKILDAYTDPVYGKTIIIDHGARISSLYMHLNSMFVVKGATVKQGNKIGTLGQTGLASAPHLHLSIKIDGESVDPLSFVRNFK